MATPGAVSIQKDSEMQSAINANSGAVNVLHTRVESLAKKMEPVLRAAGPTCGKDCESAPPSSVPVIQQIESETGKIRGITAIIEDLVARLPL